MGVPVCVCVCVCVHAGAVMRDYVQQCKYNRVFREKELCREEGLRVETLDRKPVRACNKVNSA
jgi:hypothetical protein